MPEFPEYELVANGRILNLLGVNPAWVYHKVSSGSLNGNRPTTAGIANPDLVYPNELRAGYAKFDAIDGDDTIGGGRFYHLAKLKKPVMIHNVDLSGAGTISAAVTVNFNSPSDPNIRNVQSLLEASPFVPFILAPNEMLKVTSDGDEIGLLASIHEGIEQVF